MDATTSATTERFGVYDFGLTAEEDERAARLHAESVIIDMLFQGPCGYRSLADVPVPQPTANLELAWREAAETPVREAIAGDRSDFEAVWLGSGLTAGNRQASFLPDHTAFAIAQAQFDRLPWLTKALTAEDIRRAKADGKAAGLVSTQDAEGIDRRLMNLQMAYDFGMRMIGLTYNMQNAVGGGCTERTDAGVSNFGAAVIAKMDELGIIVDTSHSCRQTTLDACLLSERPVVASHTSAEGVYPVDRAKSDDELRAIAETDGVIGVYAVPWLLAGGQGVTIESMLDHIDYICDLVGSRHVGIGTDWPLQANKATLEAIYMPWMYQIGFRPEHNVGIDNVSGFDDYRDFPNITRGLVSRGYDDDEIRGILGENFLRVFEAVCG